MAVIKWTQEVTWQGEFRNPIYYSILQSDWIYYVIWSISLFVNKQWLRACTANSNISQSIEFPPLICHNLHTANCPSPHSVHVHKQTKEGVPLMNIYSHQWASPHIYPHIDRPAWRSVECRGTRYCYLFTKKGVLLKNKKFSSHQPSVNIHVHVAITKSLHCIWLYWFRSYMNTLRVLWTFIQYCPRVGGVGGCG